MQGDECALEWMIPMIVVHDGEDVSVSGDACANGNAEGRFLNPQSDVSSAYRARRWRN